MPWKADLDSALANAFTMDEFQRLLVQRVQRPNAQFQGVGDYDDLRSKAIETAQQQDWLKRLVAEGKVKPAIDRTFPLGQIVEALRWVDDGHAMGKVLVLP